MSQLGWLVLRLLRCQAPWEELNLHSPPETSRPPHFTYRETEAQRGELGWVHLGPHSWQVPELWPVPTQACRLGHGDQMR